MRVRNLKRKLTCFAATAALCMTSMNLSGFAADKTTVPDWVPQTYEAAKAFNDEYGVTHLEDGVICFVYPEQARVIDLFYNLKDMDDHKDQLLYNEVLDIQSSQVAYEVWAYKPDVSTTSDFKLEYGGGITGAVTELFNYSFKTDKKGNITETDVYSWAPDCNKEYREYIKTNPHLVLRDNYLAYWDDVCYDGGCTLKVKQEGEGSFEKIADDNFYQSRRVEGQPAIPGDWGGDIFQLYKPEKPGDVTITFTNGQQPPNFNKVSEDAQIIEKKYTIQSDGTVKEQGKSELPDWIPTNNDEYVDYIKSNPKVVLRDNLVVYWGSEAGSFCNVDTVSGSGEFEMTKINCSRPLAAGAVGGSDNYVKVYKPKKAGTVTMSWTYGYNGMSKTRDFITIDNSVDRSYKIDQDMNVTETFDWVPKTVKEYEQYLKRHEAIAENGDYIVYCSWIDARMNMGEGYDTDKLNKLSKNAFSRTDVDGEATYYSIVYGKTDKIKSGDTVDMTWWSEHGDVRTDAKTKSFKYNGAGFETVKLKGDINNSGSVSKETLKVFGRYLTKKDRIDSFENSDMNDDGQINVKDYLILKRQVVKDYKVVEEPVANETKELTADIKPFSIQSAKPTDTFENSQINFALSLLRNTVDSKENVLVSPYSVAQALSMTANGADNNTLKEMMKVIGGGMDIDTFNKQMASYRIGQPNDEKCKLLTANSIWCTSDKRFTVNEDFLLNNKSYYDAQIFSTPFNDSSVTAVNGWVKEHTDGMIPEIIERFTGQEIMALINAVTFDAKWLSPYEESYENSSFFKAVNGKIQKASVLAETRNVPYLEDNEAKGFMKYYDGERYAFAAILPNEGVSIDKYVSGLTAEKLSSLLSTAEKTVVHSMMPKFKTDYSSSLTQTLEAMGIKDAFNGGAADFSKMGESTEGNIFISDVIHKTHIDVDEEGTKAAAATAVIMKDNAAFFYEDIKEVILNRPFVYAIVDIQTNIPIFIGTLLTLE